MAKKLQTNTGAHGSMDYLRQRQAMMLKGTKKKDDPTDKKKTARKSIKPRSPKMTKQMRLYAKEVAEFLAKEENEVCIIRSPDCTVKATCVNHKRRRGKNLRNQKDWEPACGPCNSYIENHDQWARDNGHLLSVHKNQDK